MEPGDDQRKLATRVEGVRRADGLRDTWGWSDEGEFRHLKEGWCDWGNAWRVGYLCEEKAS